MTVAKGHVGLIKPYVWGREESQIMLWIIWQHLFSHVFITSWLLHRGILCSQHLLERIDWLNDYTLLPSLGVATKSSCIFVELCFTVGYHYWRLQSVQHCSLAACRLSLMDAVNEQWDWMWAMHNPLTKQKDTKVPLGFCQKGIQCKNLCQTKHAEFPAHPVIPCE